MKMNRYNIFCEDCIQGMNRLENRSVDLIIADPPYGDNYAYGTLDKKILNDENPIINLQALEQYWRVLKMNKTCYLFTNWKHYPFLFNYVKQYTKFNLKTVIVWKKKNLGFGFAFRNQHEFIMVLEKGKPKYKFNNFGNVQEFGGLVHTKDSHPHQKPIELIKKLIEHSSNEGDVILDSFFGSAKTLDACKDTDRNFYGFELDPKYFNPVAQSLEF